MNKLGDEGNMVIEGEELYPVIERKTRQNERKLDKTREIKSVYLVFEG